MFTTILSSVTKALFQLFEVKISPPNVFDSYQSTEQFYQEELHRDAHAGANFDLYWTQDEEEDTIFVEEEDTIFVEEEDAVLVDRMETEGQITRLIDAYCIGQPGINRLHFMACIAAEGIMKTVSTSARLASSYAISVQRALQKKALNLVSATPAVEEEPIMEGFYDADGSPLIERLDDSNFGAVPFNRESRRAEDIGPEDECMDTPMQALSGIESEDDTWDLYII